MSECCANCFFVREQQDKKKTEYVCHRFPPMTGYWPHVRSDRWCGEWKAKENGEKE